MALLFAVGVCLGAVSAFALARSFSASLQEYCDAALALHASARACALTRVHFIAYPNSRLLARIKWLQPAVVRRLTASTSDAVPFGHLLFSRERSAAQTRRPEMTPTYLILNSPTGDLAQYGERNSSHGAAISAIACRVGRAETHMERNVKKLLITSAALITALCTLAFVAFATPASAGEYCRRDVTSYMLSCSFDNMEQCHEMSSGRGGRLSPRSLPARCQQRLCLCAEGARFEAGHPPHKDADQESIALAVLQGIIAASDPPVPVSADDGCGDVKKVTL